ncbi:MAG: radical SAM protein [Vicinamibacterales bacterium]
MQSSQFNLRVPLADAGSGNDVFLMNTFTDAQLVVSRDVAALLDRLDESGAAALEPDHAAALATLTEQGFVVQNRRDERERLEAFFRDVREGEGELRVTLLTTLQCNFACDYCFQGDHGDYNKTAAKMTMATAARVAEWCEARMDSTRAERFVLTFFGGEPLLNLPVMYYLAERLWHSTQHRRLPMTINVITNGLLLTPDVVDRLEPFGLNGFKITLDGDRDTHNRMRPLRGGQGTFDKIVANIRRIAGRCRLSIGGNFDESSAASYPALLEFLASQEFAPQIGRVAFKPIIRERSVKAATTANGTAKFIGLSPVDASGSLNGTCMTSAGSGTSSGGCDTCHFADDQMSFLRDETKKHGFATSDGVHMGPCEIHRKHAYTIGPEGDLYACPGFTGERSLSTGHIDGSSDARRSAAALKFDQLAAWKACHDCAFIPVCAGGCTVASHTERGDMNAPSCHKKSFEAGVASMARDAAASLMAMAN